MLRVGVAGENPNDVTGEPHSYSSAYGSFRCAEFVCYDTLCVTHTTVVPMIDETFFLGGGGGYPRST